ncbi:MAG: hypothetical protein ACI88H_000708 [Cocleimonas sp.]|jgi:hypothetical protein
MKLMTGLHPIRNESIRSYLIRLALANDYDMTNHLLSEYQSTKQTTLSSCEESLISQAHTLMKIDDKYAFSPIYTGEVDLSNRLGHHAITQRNPCICADCMATQNYTDSHWQLYPITHCHLHHKRLLSHCVYCDEALVWDQDLLSYGCCQCDASWQQIAAKQHVENVPTYIQYFHQLPDEERSDYLEDLLTACMRALRPYDSVHHGVKQLPHCEIDWTQLCNQAFSLLTDRRAIEQWCQSMIHVRKQYGVLGDKAIFYPLKTMQVRLHQTWLVNGYKPSLSGTSPSIHLLPHHELTSCNARNDSVSHFNADDKNQGFIHQIDQSGFAQMLGCERSLVKQLFKIPSISSLSPVGRGRFSFIDITEFINQTKTQNTAKQCQTSKLIELTDILHDYTMTGEDILVEVYKHNLPIYVDRAANTLLEAICINEALLVKHLETTYLNHEPCISLSRTVKILGIPRNQVLQLGALKLLIEVPNKPNLHDYSGQSIAQFLVDNICIDRWAALHHSCASKVIKALKYLGVSPIIPPYVFTKTQTLLDTLRTESCDKWQAQEQLELF